MHKTVAQEIQVLEHAQDAQVQHDIDRRPCLVTAAAVALHHQRRAPRGHRGEQDKAQHAPVPPTIEHITGGKQEQVLQLETVAQPPIDKEYQGKEQGVGIGVKLHNCRLLNNLQR